MNFKFTNCTMIVLLCSIFSQINAFGQELTQDYTIRYINERLQENTRLHEKKGAFVITTSKNGKAIRIDEIYPEDIDRDKLRYSEDIEAIMLDCFSRAEDCVEREIVSTGARKAVRATSLLTTCEGEECDHLLTAVNHLISMWIYDDYSRTKPFEEN